MDAADGVQQKPEELLMTENTTAGRVARQPSAAYRRDTGHTSPRRRRKAGLIAIAVAGAALLSALIESAGG